MIEMELRCFAAMAVLAGALFVKLAQKYEPGHGIVWSLVVLVPAICGAGLCFFLAWLAGEL